jgi:hypothetical protein
MRRPADPAEGAGESEMGTVVKFPGVQRGTRTGKSAGKNLDSAIVIILPVIRIERLDQRYEPQPIRAQRRRRRPRASRT